MKNKINIESTGTESRSIRDLMRGYDDRFEKTFQEIKRIVRSTDKILDIGCGEGKIWHLFPPLNIYGLDFSKKNLKVAKRFLHPVFGNAEEIPFPNRSFDLVIASEILEHLFRPDKTIQEINRVLKKGGHAVITFPNTGGIQFRTSVLLWGENPALNYPENFNHIRFFSIKNIKEMLVGTDLKIEKVRGTSFLAFHPENFGLYIPVPRPVRVLGGDLFASLSLGNLVVLAK